jgi:TM2 domain-containing membrane protein YozV
MATPPQKNTKFCINCGEEIDARAEICPKCGVRVAPPPASVPPQPVITEHKTEGLAAVLSFIFVGLGQIYNGQIGKGILFIILGIIFAALMIILIGIPLYLILWVYNIYDAYNTAKKINAGLIKT